jgi:hypothetical protein
MTMDLQLTASHAGDESSFHRLVIAGDFPGCGVCIFQKSTFCRGTCSPLCDICAHVAYDTMHMPAGRYDSELAMIFFMASRLACQAGDCADVTTALGLRQLEQHSVTSAQAVHDLWPRKGPQAWQERFTRCKTH